MKSYIQGLITGSVFVFAFFVVLGGSKSPEIEPDPIGRYLPIDFNLWNEEWDSIKLVGIIDTKTGDLYTTNIFPKYYDDSGTKKWKNHSKLETK